MSDLLVSRTPNNNGAGVVTFTLFEPPATTTGIQLLGQRVVALLCRRMSTRFGRGTDLLNILNRSNSNDPTVNNAVAQAVAQVRDQLVVTDTTPDDERLDRIEIVEITREADSLFIHLRITTVAGEAATFTLPSLL